MKIPQTWGPQVRAIFRHLRSFTAAQSGPSGLRDLRPPFQRPDAAVPAPLALTVLGLVAVGAERSVWRRQVFLIG